MKKKYFKKNCFISIVFTLLILINCHPPIDFPKDAKKSIKLADNWKQYTEEELSERIKLDSYLNFLGKKKISVEERAIFNGLLWLNSYVLYDLSRYAFVFSDYILILNEMSLNEKNSIVKEAASRMIHYAMMLAQRRLDKLFYPDDKWDFISALYYFKKWEHITEPIINFYTQNYKNKKLESYKGVFEKAMLKKDYDLLGDVIISSSFLYLCNESLKNSFFNLRKSDFYYYINRIKDLDYIHSFESDFSGYWTQNYFVTHLLFVVIFYGEKAYNPTFVSSTVKDYIQKEFPIVRYKVHDLDLLAEFVQCRKIYNDHDNPETKEAVKYMLSIQNADGSWGTKADFSGDAYEAIHPTWAVISALNYRPLKLPELPLQLVPSIKSKSLK